MPTQSKATLKTYFISDATPDEPEFIDLIDSMLNVAETGTQYIAGEIVAPSVQADSYNLEAITITDINNISLTGSNQFGTSSQHIQSFSGSFHQSGGCDSYFLNNLSIGTTTSPQSCHGGLAIYKDKTIGSSTQSLEQAASSSLLISGSHGQLTFDVNEIHCSSSINLQITSQGTSDNRGSIEFRTGNTLNTVDQSDIMILTHDQRVGINTLTPKSVLHIQTPNALASNIDPVAAATGSSLLISRSGYDHHLAFDANEIHQYGHNLYITAQGNTSGEGNIYFRAKVNPTDLGNDTRMFIKADGNIGIGSETPDKKLTVIGDISASALLYASSSNANGSNYNTLLVDTNTGRFYHTGSYGGGGGGGGTTVSANDGGSGASLTDITVDGTTFSVGGGFWQNHSNGVELVTSADNVGIGSAPSNTHKLSVNGNGVFSGDVIAYYTSDKRLKDNIKPIEDPIGKIKQIGGYSFDWNDKQNTYEGTDFGVIAQEIEEVLPSLVQTREDGFKGVKYDKIVSLLIEAVKDQQKQIDELKKLI